MSKKHFEAFAAAISQIKDAAERERTARLIAGVCAGSNPRFDLGTFLTACGV